MERPAMIIGATALLACAQPAYAVTVSGNYYEDQAVSASTVTCPISRFCTLTFTLGSSTAGKVLTVTEIACNGSVSQRLGTAVAFLSDNGGNSRRFRALNVGGQTPGGLFSWSNPMQYKITGGPPRLIHVQLETDTATSWIVSCSVVGTISDS